MKRFGNGVFKENSQSTKRVATWRDKLVDATRIRTVVSCDSKSPSSTSTVVYWMSRDQRVEDNWAFLLAQQKAMEWQLPLAVIFNLLPKFLEGTIRQFGFMIKGLQEVERKLAVFNIPFFLLQGDPVKNVTQFVEKHNTTLLVTDYSPMRIGIKWKKDIAKVIKCTFQEVDAHNIVPVWVASDRIEYAARTIRPKIMGRLGDYLVEFPSLEQHPHKWSGDTSPIDWKAAEGSLQVDRSVKEVHWIVPGETSALEGLKNFLETRLRLYPQRNDPNVKACSDLSPWLHFGQLSAQRVALNAQKANGISGKAEFLEELIVRRELAENYCHYNPDGYDRLSGLYPQYNNQAWAQKTLREHATDKREFLYTRDQLESGDTHDPLWNSAQLEMVKRGKMHGFMRMYWAKKILEWTNSPKEALDIAIYLNDRYELDGHDPNGYVGCAWAIAGLHDQGWKERPVFGKIRYMNFKGCQKKFDVQKYINRVNAAKTTTQSH